MNRILFVEDEAAFAVGMMDRLQSEGYEVEWAQTGPAGYKMALTRPFDLVVLDVMLPGKSGFDICRDLRLEAGSRRLCPEELRAHGTHGANRSAAQALRRRRGTGSCNIR